MTRGKGKDEVKSYPLSLSPVKDKEGRVGVMKYVIISLIVCITIVAIAAIIGIMKRK